MTTLKPVLIAASLVFAGPALAVSMPYFPNLTFPEQNVVVTQNAAKILTQRADKCTSLEHDAEVSKDACGTTANPGLVKRKLGGDE